MANIGGIDIKITADDSDLNKGLKKAESNLSNFGKQVGNDLAGKLAGAFAIDAIAEYGKKIIDITAQFQKLGAVLETSLGDRGGRVAFAQIKQFAAETNFSVLELTDSFVKLTNQGFQPTQSELKKLADLANSTGKSFDQLAEAVLDAQRGEFERLKEFGISASKSGENVTFAFKGVQTTVKGTTENIKDYILSLGDLNGVQGTTEKISLTLGGQISNLGDAFDKLFNTIGDGKKGVLSDFIRNFTNTINLVADGIRTAEQLNADLQNRALAGQKGVVEERIRERGEATALLGIEYNLNNAKTKQYELEYQIATVLKNKSQYSDKTLADLQEQLAKNKEQLEISEEQRKIFDDLTGKTKARKDAEQATAAAVKSQTDTYQKVQDILAKVATQFSVLTNQQNALVQIGEGFNLSAEKAKILETAIKGVIELGLSPASAEVQRLVSLFDQLGNFKPIKLLENQKLDSQKVTPAITGGNPGKVDDGGAVQASANLTIARGKEVEANFRANESLKLYEETARRFSESVTTSIQSASTNFVTGIGEMLGATLAGNDGFANFGKFLIGTLADLAISVGKIAIGIGISLSGIKAALETLNPVAAIVAGVALVALGTAAKSLLSKQAPKLATGTNYVPQDMLAFIHKGEAVVPKKYNPALGSGSGFQVYGELVADGTKLIAVIKSATNLQTRRS